MSKYILMWDIIEIFLYYNSVLRIVSVKKRR